VLPGHEFPRFDHRSFRPAGWVEAGREKLDRLRSIAERRGLTMLQLACEWNLAHPPVYTVVPTLIQESGADAKAIEAKREELAAISVPDGPDAERGPVLSADEVREIRAVGDNTGCMALKGASPEFEGDAQPDRWPLTDELVDVAARWQIHPGEDLVQTLK
jgi:hypothetical protein